MAIDGPSPGTVMICDFFAETDTFTVVFVTLSLLRRIGTRIPAIFWFSSNFQFSRLNATVTNFRARRPLSPLAVAGYCEICALFANHFTSSKSNTWTRRRAALPHVLVVVAGTPLKPIACRDTFVHIIVVWAGVMPAWTGGATVRRLAAHQ